MKANLSNYINKTVSLFIAMLIFISCTKEEIETIEEKIYPNEINLSYKG